MLSLYSLLPVVLLLGLTSCVTTEPKPVASPPAEPLSQSEQDKRALEIFDQLVAILSEGDRKAALPKAEELYLKIINEYPAAALGQECYWRLILINLRDYVPPRLDKAEAHHRDFLKKYPQSPLKHEIEDALTKAYYANGKWEKLLVFYAPVIRRYIETGKLERPYDIYYYAEAKMNLGDLVEAEKGYKIIVSVFPQSREGSLAVQRLAELAKKKNSTNKK